MRRVRAAPAGVAGVGAGGALAWDSRVPYYLAAKSRARWDGSAKTVRL